MVPSATRMSTELPGGPLLWVEPDLWATSQLDEADTVSRLSSSHFETLVAIQNHSDQPQSLLCKVCK